MKNNQTWKYLINPFIRTAGWQAFLIGLAFFALAVAIGGQHRTWFDSVLDMRIGGVLPYYMGFIFLAVDIICITLVMWIAALIVSKTFRFIDIMGTMTLSFAPNLIYTLACLTISFGDAAPGTVVPISGGATIALSILCVPLLIWRIVLMYNGFRVSCDLRGARLTVTFIIALIVAVLASKMANGVIAMKLLAPEMLN